MTYTMSECLLEVNEEVTKAVEKFPPMNSAHEGYGVLREEFCELERWVFMKQHMRDLAEMKKEAIQIAAMAVRFAVEVCNEERGRR